MSFGTFISRHYPSGAERFFASPPGQRLVAQAEAEHEADLYATRASLAAKAAHIEQQLTDALPALQKAVADASAAHAKARAAANAAAAKLRIAQAKRYDATASAESQVKALKARLRQTAPPAIDAFIDQLRAEWEDLRNTPFAFHEQPAGFKGRKQVAKHFSNVAAVKRRLAALLAAVREVETLKEQAIRTEDLPAIFEGIRAALPDATAMEEIVPVEEHIGRAWAASA